MTTAPILAPPSHPLLPSVLEEFFSTLDEAPRLDLEVLEQAVSGLDLPQIAFSPLTEFTPCGYTRTLLHSTPDYEALLMCWLPGQHSTIHDHHGSSCVFRVLMGTATETEFSLDELGRVHPGVQHEYTTGEVIASAASDIHQVSNLSGEDLVTLHVYSPSLSEMRVY